MRLEGQHRRRPSQAFGALARDRNHRGVATVHAVKIAKRKNGTAQGARRLAIAHDEEIFRRH
jgi:hypothetical protein